MTLPWGHLFFIDSYRGKNTENFLSLIKSGERYRTIMVLLFDNICSYVQSRLLQNCHMRERVNTIRSIFPVNNETTYFRSTSIIYAFVGFKPMLIPKYIFFDNKYKIML